MRKRSQTPNHNSGRHGYKCTICSHKRRQEIEEVFLSWQSPIHIAKKFRVTVDSVYRHAHAAGLMDKRRRNVGRALERIIEHASEVKINAAAVVSAVAALGRLNAQGQWVHKVETVNLNNLFDRMTEQELLRYATDGVLPLWFPATSERARKSGALIATASESP